MCNADMVCPPKVSELLLNRADSSRTPITFSSHAIGRMYESMMTTGTMCFEDECAGGSRSKSKDQPVEASTQWFSKGELGSIQPVDIHLHQSKGGLAKT